MREAMQRCCSAEIMNSESSLGWISSECYVTQVFIQLECMYYSWSTREFSFSCEGRTPVLRVCGIILFSLMKQFHCNMHLSLSWSYSRFFREKNKILSLKIAWVWMVKMKQKVGATVIYAVLNIIFTFKFNCCHKNSVPSFPELCYTLLL